MSTSQNVRDGQGEGLPLEASDGAARELQRSPQPSEGAEGFPGGCFIPVPVFSKAGGPLVKALGLHEGQLQKDASQCRMARGQVRSHFIRSMHELAELLAGLRQNQAIALSNRVFEPGTPVVSGRLAAEGKVGVQRCLENMSAEKRPMLALLDFDPHPDMPRRLSPQEAVELVAQACGADAPSMARLITRSSSAGVISPDGQPLTGDDSFHVYLALTDGSDMKRFRKELEAWLWLNGCGWIFVSRAGTMIARTVLDLSVLSPERLVFEAPPVLHDGLRQHRPPPVHAGSALLDTHGLQLSKADFEGAATLKAAARALKAPAAAEVAEAYRETQAAKLSAHNGMSLERAREVVAARQDLKLHPDDLLHFDTDPANPVRVAEVLADPLTYAGQTLADPLEPDYGGEPDSIVPNKAIVRLRDDGKTEIFSQAHGGQVYELMPVLDPWTLKLIELKGNLGTWWNKLRDSEDSMEAARLAWSLCRRLCRHVPVVQPLEALIAMLREHRPAVLGAAEFAAIEAALTKWVYNRQRRAVRSVSLPDDAGSRHDVEQLGQLPALSPEDYRGVILLRAPMGSGKTKHVGAPFARWAMTNGARRTLATCHRQGLVGELARVLHLEHYQKVERERAFCVDGLATCLPSLVKEAHAQIIDETGFVFIDEIAQTLRSIASDVQVADGKSRADVFRRLVGLVRNAQCIIGADAGLDARTLSFLEECRPGERFRIIEVPPQRQGLKVSMGFGEPALVTAYGEALALLSEGKRLWIGCGEKTRAQEAAQVLEMSGKRVLLLHADNRENRPQAAFWREPEAVSRQYDVVIHNSVISSGMSIEHRADGPWFDHGMLLASGATIPPSEAAQMMRRVRYLRSWTVVALDNRLPDIGIAAAIETGMQEAACLEGLRAHCSDFDRFVAGVKTDDARARADFACGLWWVLEAQGFELERTTLIPDEGLRAQLKQQRKEQRVAERAALLAAPNVSDKEARALRKLPSRTEQQILVLRKHHIKRELGLDTLDDQALDIWDEGRGPGRIDRFCAAVYGKTEILDDLSDDLVLRRFGKARALAYRILFEGVELKPGLRIDEALACNLLQRVAQNRYLFAFLGVVPPHWAAYQKEGKKFAMPDYPLREVGEILRRMGLAMKRREGGPTLRCSDISSGDTAVSTGSVTRNYRYEITPESWKAMNAWTSRRNASPALAAILTPLEKGTTVDMAAMHSSAPWPAATLRCPDIPSGDEPNGLENGGHERQYLPLVINVKDRHHALQIVEGSRQAGRPKEQ